MNPEDLRPKTLAEVIGQPEAVRILSGMIERYRNGGIVPHILMSGPSGVGKTTCAHAFAHDLLGPDYHRNFYEMNASDQRKIDDVRDVIVPYIGQEPQDGAEFKFLFLDEADELTLNAQAALRRVIEEGSNTTRFILSANHPSKIIQALHSRCFLLRFPPLSDDDVRAILKSTAQQMGVSPSDTLIESIVAHVDGDARSAQNALMGGNDETRKWETLDGKIRELFATNGSSVSVRVEGFCQFLRQEGFSDYEEVLVSIHRIVTREKLVPEEKIRPLVEGLAMTAFRCATVAVPLLQVRSGLYGMVS